MVAGVSPKGHEFGLILDFSKVIAGVQRGGERGQSKIAFSAQFVYHSRPKQHLRSFLGCVVSFTDFRQGLFLISDFC